MNPSEFKRRRRQLMRMMGNDSVAILPTAREVIRNRDVHYEFRPDSDFYYLTGFPEPEAVLVLVPGRPQGEYILFCREKDPTKELWDGYRAGLEGAVAEYGADDAFPITDLDDILPGLLEERERVFFEMGSDPGLDKRVSDWVGQVRARARAGVHGPIEFLALDHFLHDMRLYKSRSEVATMRRAARLSAGAHCELMRRCQPGMYEYQLAALFSHHCRMAGAAHLAYPSIVGGGNNACVLHYVENRDTLQSGDLVLIDAGCEVDCYASDITRTFPVSGRFSDAQRSLYELVLEAQLAAIDKVRAGNHWNDPHQAAVRVLTKGLLKLGLLRGTLAEDAVASGRWDASPARAGCPAQASRPRMKSRVPRGAIIDDLRVVPASGVAGQCAVGAAGVGRGHVGSTTGCGERSGRGILGAAVTGQWLAWNAIRGL